MEYLSDDKLNYIIHSDKVFIENCSICDMIFSIEKEYKIHMKEHSRIKQYHCSQCDTTFENTKSQFKQLHMKEHSTHSRVKPYQCLQCDKNYATNKSLETHLRIHTRLETYLCIYCDSAFSKNSDLKRHARIHMDSTIKYKCSLCDRAFSKIFHFNSHMRVHTKERPFQCNQCDKAFTQNCNLVKHMTIHTGERPFACAECGKAFSNNSTLLDHMRIHSGEKPFGCNQCEKAFSKNSHLERHMMTHTGEKPYQCSHCEFAFNQKAHLLRHFQLAHDGEEDLQVNCTKPKLLKLSSHKTKEKFKVKKARKNTKKSKEQNKFVLQSDEEVNQDYQYMETKKKKLSTEEILMKIEKDIEDRKYLDMRIQCNISESDVNLVINKNKKLSPEIKIEEDVLKNLPSGNENEEHILKNLSPACEPEENILVKINEDYYLLEVENSEGIKMKIPTNESGSDINTEQENQVLKDVLHAIEMWLDDSTNVSHSSVHTLNYYDYQSVALDGSQN